MKNRVLYAQEKDGFCGPSAFRSLLASYGLKISEAELGRISYCTKNGTSSENLVEAVKTLGFNSFIYDNTEWEKLQAEVRKGPVVVN